MVVTGTNCSINNAMLISGNKEHGLAKSLYKLYPDAVFASRSTGYDLCSHDGRNRFAKESLNHETIILSSALFNFNQTILLDTVFKTCSENNHRPHIVNISSTTDRVKNAKVWLYNAEKKALRDYSNSLGLKGVWSDSPKITLVSFGTLTNYQYKHPDRKCLDIDLAAEYIKWVIDQPRNLTINEISIDPMQDQFWHN